MSKILQLPHYFTLPYHRTRFILLTLKRWPSSSLKLRTNSRMGLSTAMPASRRLRSLRQVVSVPMDGARDDII